MITVPEAFARATVAREGEAGRRWLASLPSQAEALCAQWQLVVDGPAMHGYLGLVIPVRRGEELCVLKLSWHDEATADEGVALAAWNGQGAVRLLLPNAACGQRPSPGALLLERLDQRRSLNDVEITTAVTIAGRLLRRLAIPAPAGLRPLSTVAQTIAQSLSERWQRNGRLLPQRLLDHAYDLVTQLQTATGNLLVNYDLHYTNVLAGKREPWLVIDPKVVAGDPEFGVAQLLWCRLEEIEAQRGLNYHFQQLIAAAELNGALAHAWTIVRCVDYWLWGLSVGFTEDPARCEIITNKLQK